MPAVDWLTQNSNRAYPFTGDAFTVNVGAFDGKAAFSDAGFTLGTSSAFEHARDHVYLDRYYKNGDLIRFVFRLEYGSGSTYEAMQCYEWVFEFPISGTPLGATVYSIPTRAGSPSQVGSENPEMGFGFLSVGDLTEALNGAAEGNVLFTEQPVIEPALLQSNVNMFVNTLRVANEVRPCPPDCACSSSSSSGSSDSGSSESSSSSSVECEDPDPTEPSALTAPVRVPLPGGQFGDTIRLKPGYNCEIGIDENANVITVRARTYGGEGMQCTDLRIDDTGYPVEETCLSCGGLVYAMNGYGYGVERLQLAGGQGVLIVPDSANHRVVVLLEEDGVCEVTI